MVGTSHVLVQAVVGSIFLPLSSQFGFSALTCPHLFSSFVALSSCTAAFAYSVSPSLQFRISNPSLLIQPILSLFFLLLFPVSCAAHSNTRVTPEVPGPRSLHLSPCLTCLFPSPITYWLLHLFTGFMTP